ncbi:LmeA family phospholipid-binding protein [Streptomyces tsukubensis]|uniref:DUF2993 domain-containing protein n=1 Tax=Streptomyces tsukubensis TaxID=83656 RepID=A0A1V4A891_9ACTN|nr:DUF2993 domain-containing protein [Streptomyces tsukubensis]OON78853.1 hypothetical protein B1H18_15970 [Streptomyces tsukubensis]QFR94330.1 DUF2993 domain-containing protein [Streptomyces tsukubensis]
MRALRILVTVVLVLGVLFVVGDRIAVHYAEGEAASRVRSSEHLASDPDVSIHGFPFLTQAAGKKLDDVEIGIKGYEATAQDAKIRIATIDAHMRGVRFSGDYSSATADSASGTAVVSYAELLKAAQAEPIKLAPGVTAKVAGLSDGGDGRLKLSVEATVLGAKVGPIAVLCSAQVSGSTVRLHADSVPDLGVPVAERSIRDLTDFGQKIEGLPGGIALDKVRAGKDGVEIGVTGSELKLIG